jgi:hypothetical protein
MHLQHTRLFMRYVVALLVTLVLAACNTTPVSHNQSQVTSPGPAIASEGQKPLTDSPLEFLLTAAATDFHAHRPPFPARFRDVRFGHFMIPAGTKQYMLCGEFLPQQREGKAEWTPFATIKTSGYEQYIGIQALSFCQRSHMGSGRGFAVLGAEPTRFAAVGRKKLSNASAAVSIVTGWSEPVPGRESHPLKSNAFHGALLRQLESRQNLTSCKRLAAMRSP